MFVLAQITKVNLSTLLWCFVAVYILFLAPQVQLASNRQPFRGAEGFVSQLIFIFSKQLHQDLFFSVCLAIASQADQNGVVLKMSEFLALLAIESHRTAAQRIEVAGSKGNASQTFANIGAVDLAWKKNGKQINNLFSPDKKKV